MDPLESALQERPFYHGSLHRDEAESLVKGRADGSFLLRKSRRGDGSYVISVAHQGGCLHYSITPTTQQNGQTLYSINKGTSYASPSEVCEHHMALKGGLKVKLEYPVQKIQAAITSSADYVMEVDWFHNEISREEDSRRLSQAYRTHHHKDGIFLVRKKDKGKYVLSLVNAGRVHRYIIYHSSTGRYYVTGKKRDFASLEELVSFHMQTPTKITGIQCQLAIPCPKTFNHTSSVVVPHAPTTSHTATKGKQFVSDLANQLKNFLPGGGLDIQWDPVRGPQDSVEESPAPRDGVPVLQASESRQWLDEYRKTYTGRPEECPGFKGIYQNLTSGGVARDMFVKEGDVAVYEQLGKGHFGAVCLGRCKIAGERQTCAIKFLTGEDVMSNKKELLAEAALMQTLDHPNIMRLIAVCETKFNLMIMLELAPLGPFRAFLKAKGENGFSEQKILNIMQQVSHGMAYIASKNIVHRDLAARNILLVSENFAKVSDFGMSKVLMETENYYRSSRPGSWPLRWYSPEALLFYKFTTKCDVWSYGVTLWEAFSYGARPYVGMKGSEILRMLEKQERLDCPMYCPQEVYDLMLYCWTYDEEARPDFNRVAELIDEIVDKSPDWQFF